MINGLFVLQVVHIFLIAISSRDSVFMWHQQLEYIGLDSLKNVLKRQFLDFNEITSIKSYKACAEAK